MDTPKEIKDILDTENTLLKQVLSEIRSRDTHADTNEKNKEMGYFNKALDLAEKLRKCRREITVEHHGKDIHAIERSPEVIKNLSLLDEARRDLENLQ
jgi:hypothetical protein